MHVCTIQLVLFQCNITLTFLDSTHPIIHNVHVCLLLSAVNANFTYTRYVSA